jgi:copper chaperone CopZ
MRGLAYGIAAIAAAGIMIGIAMTPKSPQSDGPSSSQPATAVSASPDVMTQAGTLTLNVPSMHCEFSCYPKIKETLETSEGIQEVELAKQKEEGVLDNRQVIVKYDAGFDLNAALARLAEQGYDDTEVVQ